MSIPRDLLPQGLWKPWFALSANSGSRAMAEFLESVRKESGAQHIAWFPDGRRPLRSVCARFKDVCRSLGQVVDLTGRWRVPDSMRPGAAPETQEWWVQTSGGLACPGKVWIVWGPGGLALDPATIADGLALAQALCDEREAQGATKEMLRLGQRAAGVIHDLRNRLTLISMQHQKYAMEIRGQAAPVPNREGERLLAETRALCAAFVPEPDGGGLPEWVELRTVLFHCAQNAPGLVRTQGEPAKLRLRCRADLRVFVDPAALRQVIDNLVWNALEASRAEQFVELSADQDGDRVCLTVQDQGMGMDEAGVARAFAAGEGGTHGTGFGSVSLMGALEILGAELLVDTAPGGGTTCRVWLPGPEADRIVVVVDPDTRRRERTLARLRHAGQVPLGVARCGAGLRVMGDQNPSELWLARGIHDPRLAELLALARSQACPVRVHSARESNLDNTQAPKLPVGH